MSEVSRGHFAMSFCPKCQELMQKHPVENGDIVFVCSCQQMIGGPDDTLMASEVPDTSGQLANHWVFVDNSPFDPAANIVMRDCPQCGLDFLTMIRVGANEVTMYTCICGYRKTHMEYMAEYQVRQQGVTKAQNAAK